MSQEGKVPRLHLQAGAGVGIELPVRDEDDHHPEWSHQKPGKLSNLAPCLPFGSPPSKGGMMGRTHSRESRKKGLGSPRNMGKYRQHLL